jgi:hypothetical protein
MQHKVPQFIDIEDKIFGPFTLKQFAYLAGGLGLSIIIWRTLPFSFGIFIIAPVIALTIALMFVKPNGKPFVNMVQSFLTYIFGNRMYNWQSPTQSQRMGTYTKPVQTTKINTSNIPTKNISRDQILKVAEKLNTK